jgi:hypothetical protein
MFWSKILFCILEVVEKERREKVDGWLIVNDTTHSCCFILGLAKKKIN